MLLFLIVAALIGFGGWALGAAYTRDLASTERIALTKSVETLTQARNQWQRIAEDWQRESFRAGDLARRLTDTLESVAKPTTHSVKAPLIESESIEDPPSTREADRKAMDRRRALPENRRPVGVTARDAKPPAQLRDADDDN